MQVAVFAAVCAAALVSGALLGAFWTPPDELRAALLAFAAGALVTALAFELFEEAHQTAGLLSSSAALALGATTFIVADIVLTKIYGGAEAVGLALVAAVTLDGVPENAALGVTLQSDGSYALLAAIFASNFPEAFGGAAKIREDEGRLVPLLIWGTVAVLLASAVVGGFFAASIVSENVTGLLLAFAAGAVLASIADTILPVAFAEGGPLIAFATAAGFLVAYALSTV